MEEKINIAEILKDKPVGLKLYSPTFGCIRFNGVYKDKVYFYSEDTNVHSVKSNGKMYDSGECIIFPSKEMRDWNKFAWKKGDALSCGVDNFCIFEKWANKEYTEFYAKFVTPNYSGNTFKTEKWSKETNESVIKQYISNIEEFKGGKLNLTTLEIEKTQPEFKIGDILFVKYNNRNIIFILSNINGKFYNHRVRLDSNKVIINYSDSHFQNEGIEFIRYATDEEKQRLFDALAKKNKGWDAEKKEVVDLKPKVELNPFDKVLSRRCSEDYWVLNFYSHKTDYYHICIDGSSNLYCIPYNEETAHLLGTTDDWKGGEG